MKNLSFYKKRIKEVFERNNYNLVQTLVYLIVMVAFIGSIVFVIFKLITAPQMVNDVTDKPRSQYVLMLLQCMLGIVVLFLPSALEKKFKVEIPSFMVIMFFVFLYAAIYLGEVKSFYYRVPHWDMILHAFSGLMIGAVGFSVVNILNQTDRVDLNPLFVALFAFCFAMTIDVMWEVYEYLADIVLGTNMQKFASESGQLFVGNAALTDTMQDLIVDGVGAMVMAVIGYISLKLKTGWLENVLIKRREKSARKREY